MLIDSVSLEAQIRTYIAKNLLFSEDGFPYSDDASFLKEGIIDSIGVLDLVAFIEENFGVTIDDRDLTAENFDSVSKLAAFIRRISRETN